MDAATLNNIKNSFKLAATLTTLDSESTGSTNSLDSAHANNDQNPTTTAAINTPTNNMNMNENSNYSTMSHDLFNSPRNSFEYPMQSGRSGYGNMFRQSTGGVLPSRRQSTLLSGGSIMPNFILYDGGNQEYGMEGGEDFSGKGCCLECGMFTFLSKCNAHCDLQLCDSCQQKHWQIEISDLIKMKNFLETSVTDLRKYLSAKKMQCNENIKNSAQIKRFVNMTMQQIKRKIELELENKRDELFNSIEAFVDNQKKISQSINEDTFQSTDRICSEIENLVLSPDESNLIKVKSLKTFARSCAQKLNQQRASKIPLYSIFFVPDSNIQINNTFGKIVLKSFNDGEENLNNDFGDTMSISNGMIDDEFQNFQNSDFPFESAQVVNKMPAFELPAQMNTTSANMNRRSLYAFSAQQQQQQQSSEFMNHQAPVKRATSLFGMNRNSFSPYSVNNNNNNRQMRQEMESKINENNKENIVAAEEVKKRQQQQQAVQSKSPTVIKQQQPQATQTHQKQENQQQPKPQEEEEDEEEQTQPETKKEESEHQSLSSSSLSSSSSTLTTIEAKPTDEQFSSQFRNNQEYQNMTPLQKITHLKVNHRNYSPPPQPPSQPSNNYTYSGYGYTYSGGGVSRLRRFDSNSTNQLANSNNNDEKNTKETEDVNNNVNNENTSNSSLPNSSTSTPSLSQTQFQKSFKQPIYNQGPKLVNF